MRIGIKPDDKILTIEDEGKAERYKFTDILLSKNSPIWIVNLIDSGILILDFSALKSVEE